MLIVGLDCATKPGKTGMACATFTGSVLQVQEASVGKNRAHLIDTLSAWLLTKERAILAIDAPLGWPRAMGELLSAHTAGSPIDIEGDIFFQRETDRVLRHALGKRPLEIGANLIARTALSALGVLADLRLNMPIEMGWSPGEVQSRHAIEVYPAATLVSRGIRSSNYKQREATSRRSEILDALGIVCEPAVWAQAVAIDHVLDAVIACVAGSDYAAGNVVPPSNLELATTEGWIWFRDELDNSS